MTKHPYIMAEINGTLTPCSAFAEICENASAEARDELIDAIYDDNGYTDNRDKLATALRKFLKSANTNLARSYMKMGIQVSQEGFVAPDPKEA